MLLLVSGCSGGASADELAGEIAPIVDAHDELRDFAARVGAGLTYGDILSDWPNVSARVVRQIEDFDSDGHDDANSCDELTYVLAVASAHDAWAEVVSAVGDYIREDGAEATIGKAYSDADIAMSVAGNIKDDALEPGDQCDDESEQ